MSVTGKAPIGHLLIDADPHRGVLVWECEDCRSLISDVTAHEKRCPNRPRPACTLRVGDLLTRPCGCGCPASVHTVNDGEIVCSVCRRAT